MRVAGGQKRGTLLNTLPGQETRPTLDHVKEAVFSMISHALFGAWILDLYAGSGSIGLEALSRGAAYAVFVDLNPDAIGVIRGNVNKLRFESFSQVLATTDIQAMTLFSKNKRQFNVIYLDPPFGKVDLNQKIDLILKMDLLADEGLIILEEAYMTRITLQENGLEHYKDKQYGRISIRILRRTI